VATRAQSHKMLDLAVAPNHGAEARRGMRSGFIARRSGSSVVGSAEALLRPMTRDKTACYTNHQAAAAALIDAFLRG
jgi:hypothetical protein